MMKRWCAIFGSRMAQLPWMRLFLDTLLYNIILMYLSAFWLYETHKRSLELLQSYDYVSFLGPKWPTSPEYIFFQKIINIILMYLLDPSIVQDFWQKILEWIQSYDSASFLLIQWPLAQKMFLGKNH